MKTENLMQWAEGMPVRQGTDAVLGAVEVLRGKGYRFREIHRLLLEQGAEVHPVPSTFTSVVSRRLKRARLRAMEGAK